MTKSVEAEGPCGNIILYMWPYFSLLYTYYLSSLSDKWLDSASVNNFTDGGLLTHRKNKRICMNAQKRKDIEDHKIALQGMPGVA